MLKGADIVLQCLRAEGVELVFGYPGGAIMPLYDALEGSGIRHILTRHEQGAVFAAEGYARVTGEVGVAMATSGPGATNLVTGIADAKMDSVPLVCITGQVRSALIGSNCRRILLGAQRASWTGGDRHSHRHAEGQERIFGAGEVYAARAAC
jgi:acetolactate synthase-1/2/3 large subunit